MKTNLITLSLLLVALATAHGQTTTGTPPPPPPANVPGPDGQGPGDRRDMARGQHRGPGQPGQHNGFRQGPGGRNHQPGGQRGQAHGLTSLTTVTGTVGELTGNDDYILNGFTLSANSAPAMAVQFPPHLGQQVQRAVKAGSTVSVTGFSDRGPEGTTRFHMTSLTAGKTTVIDAPPVMPTSPPPTPTLTTTSGKITDYKVDRQGRVNGLVINDNNVVRIPPHVAYQLTNLAKKGTDITVQGYVRTPGEGQVQLQKMNILRASVLTINGQQYLVR